jgi:hypothetical protein
LFFSDLSLSTSFGASSPVSPLPEEIDEDETKQAISTMEKLLDHYCHSNQSCARVITAFKIAQVRKQHLMFAWFLKLEMQSNKVMSIFKISLN